MASDPLFIVRFKFFFVFLITVHLDSDFRTLWLLEEILPELIANWGPYQTIQETLKDQDGWKFFLRTLQTFAEWWYSSRNLEDVETSWRFSAKKESLLVQNLNTSPLRWRESKIIGREMKNRNSLVLMHFHLLPLLFLLPLFASPAVTRF